MPELWFQAVRAVLRFASIATLLSLGMLGCKVVNPSDVTGTWVVTNESRQRLLPGSQRKATAKMVLEANGTFAASAVPEDLLYGSPESADRFWATYRSE